MKQESTLSIALKELGRLVVFAIPAILIQVVTDNPNLTLGYGSVILGVLRAVDKAIHDNPDIKSKGLLPF